MKRRERETYWMFMEGFLLSNAEFFSCEATIFSMHQHIRKEHGIDNDDGYYVSCCSTNVSTLV